MVGSSGSASERMAEVTANARSVPALMCSIAGGVVENTACTCPPIRSVSAGATPQTREDVARATRGETEDDAHRL